MLKELWQYVTTPCEPVARKMGYLYEAIAMQARFERCRDAWEPHYQQCAEVIQQAVNDGRVGGCVVVFGAGSLSDLPLQALSQRFAKVILVDRVFLKSTRNKVKSFSNMQLVEADVTESLDSLYNGILQIASPKAWLDHQDVHWVISLNLITQLPLLPIAWLKRRFGIVDEELEQLGQTLIEAHLKYLQAFDCSVCLIADKLVQEFNKQGELIETLDPWWGVEQPSLEREWGWEVVPLKESKRGEKRRINRVGVAYLNRDNG